jgi:hypothetical protein
MHLKPSSFFVDGFFAAVSANLTLFKFALNDFCPTMVLYLQKDFLRHGSY